MNILHICNDYGGSKVHRSLIQSLDEIENIFQHVYCPIRNKLLIDSNRFDGNRVSFSYSYIIRPWHRYFYGFKRNTIYKDICKSIDLSKFDIIHAQTLFSDGGVAYSIKKKYGTPYIIAIRNTDLYSFAKLQPHLWKIGRKILLNASSIVFISKAHLEEFLTLRFIRPILSIIRPKLILQPNGIDRYWLDNIVRDENVGNNILYIGNFSPNKNVVRLIQSIKELRERKDFAKT